VAEPERAPGALSRPGPDGVGAGEDVDGVGNDGMVVVARDEDDDRTVASRDTEAWEWLPPNPLPVGVADMLDVTEGCEVRAGCEVRETGSAPVSAAAVPVTASVATPPASATRTVHPRRRLRLPPSATTGGCRSTAERARRAATNAAT
jgi:hypothetical protein